MAKTRNLLSVIQDATASEIELRDAWFAYFSTIAHPQYDKEFPVLLIEAAKAGNDLALEWLDGKSKSVYRALHMHDYVDAFVAAAFAGKQDIVEDIFDMFGKSIVNKTSTHLSYFGMTALMAACIGGHTATVKYLIANDADPHLKNENTHQGKTALLYAVEKDWYTIVDFLLEYTSKSTMRHCLSHCKTSSNSRNRLLAELDPLAIQIAMKLKSADQKVLKSESNITTLCKEIPALSQQKKFAEAVALSKQLRLFLINEIRTDFIESIAVDRVKDAKVATSEKSFSVKK